MSEPNEETPASEEFPLPPGLSVEVETTAPCVATVRFTAAEPEIVRLREVGLKKLGRNARYKGFRPGKAPLHLLEKDFGARVSGELVQLFINQAYDVAVRRDGLRPAATPRIDEESIRFVPGEDFSHEFQVWLRPEVELGEYKGLTIEGTRTSVTDEELDAAIVEFKRHESRPEEAGDEGLPKNGVATCKVEFLVPEEEESILSRDGVRVTPEIAINGVDEAAFAEGLTGAKVGDAPEFEMAFPADFPVESARNRTGTVRLTISEAYRIIPPTDEEFLRMVGAEDEEDMRTKLRERMTRSKEDQERNRIEMTLIDRLVQENPMEVAEEMIQQQVEAKLDEVRQSMADTDLDEAQKEERIGAERDQAWEQTSRAVRAVYIMEEIARLEDIQVTQEDVVGEIQSIAERNGTTVDEVRKYYQEQGLFQQLGMELLERKVRNFLRESADIQPAE